MLAVLVLNDSVGGLVEAATYCAPNDEKRPVVVGLPDFTTTVICPEDGTAVAELTDASPDSWYVRVMFDELLDPNIEDLIEILDDNDQPTGTFDGSLARTQPVTLECVGVDGAMHNVDYDGYYSPSGNSVTWPLGPSLVIKQVGTAIVPTNSECQITLKDTIKDKQGNSVPMAQRGPFKFKIAPLKLLVVDPSDGSNVDAFQLYFDNYYAQFNSEVDIDSLCPDDGNGLCGAGTAFDISPNPGGICAVNFNNCTTDTDCDALDPADTCSSFYAYSLAPFGFTPAEFGFGPISPAETETEYTFTFKEGAKLRDQCGAETTLGAPSVGDQTKVTVTTNKFDLKSIVPNPGDTIAPNRKIRLNFNNVLDLATLDATEFTLTPAVANGAVDTSTEGDFFFAGDYAPGTDYTFTINAGAEVADAYGVTYTFATPTTVNFKTQPIALTSSSPANGSTVTKAAPTSATNILFTFNQNMDATTFDAADIELTGAPAVLTFGKGTSGTSGTRLSDCTPESTSCRLRVSGVFTPGDYQIVLKKDAVIKDALGNDYTQAADRVIRFTVRESTPSAVIPCLGAP